MFDEIDPKQVSLTSLLDAKVVLIMCDADRPSDEPKMVGLVKDPEEWRGAHKEMLSLVPDGKRVKILLWELKGEAGELAESADIIGGM